MIVLLLALALQGMTDEAYTTARERANPTAAQAQEPVTEALLREDFGASVILHTNGLKRSECIIEAERRITCVRSTEQSANHVHFEPPVVTTTTGDLDVAAIRTAERLWVELD